LNPGLHPLLRLIKGRCGRQDDRKDIPVLAGQRKKN